MTVTLKDLTTELLANPDVKRGYVARGSVIATACFLRDLRRATGLTQSQLAQRLDVAQSRIATLESEQRVCGPSVDMLYRYVDACGKRLVLTAESR
jgi:DNA-binding XRE family transcriptional regulator